MGTKVEKFLESLPPEAVTALGVCGSNLSKGIYWGLIDSDDWVEIEEDLLEDAEQPDLLNSIVLGKKTMVVAVPSILLGTVAIHAPGKAQEFSEKMSDLNDKARKRLYSRLYAIVQHVVDTGQITQKLLLGLYSNNLGDYVTYGSAGKERRVLGFQCTFEDVVEVIPYILGMFKDVPLSVGFEAQDGSIVPVEELLEYLNTTKGSELKMTTSNGDNGVLAVLVITRG